jgi:hypothetical protein
MDKPKKITIDDVVYIRESDIQQVPELGDRVLVRTRNAGVHVGTLETRNALDTVLTNANRIWRWRGAFTLSEVANNGVDRSDFTRIASMVSSITLTTSDTCEIIPVAKGVDLTECHND